MMIYYDSTTFTQATSVLGHRTSSQKPLSVPTSDAEKARLRQRRYTLAKYMEERADTLNRHFDYVSLTLLCSNTL